MIKLGKISVDLTSSVQPSRKTVETRDKCCLLVEHCWRLASVEGGWLLARARETPLHSRNPPHNLSASEPVYFCCPPLAPGQSLSLLPLSPRAHASMRGATAPHKSARKLTQE